MAQSTNSSLNSNNNSTNASNSNSTNGTGTANDPASQANSTNSNAALPVVAATPTLSTTSKTVTPPPPSSSSSTAAAAAASTNSNNILLNSEARWIFPPEKIENTPSRLDAMSKEDELAQRQQSALFISDLGGRLKVNQLCINTAIIYMHRFYMIHSLKKFHNYFVATACLYFACKVEEQPRRLREFIEQVQYLLHRSNEPISINNEEYRRYGDEIMALESCLIQTLGFNVLINHAHTVIIKTCQMIKAPRDLAEAAYLTATNSLILTNFCVKFSSEKVACFCIYLACKWTRLKIPVSTEGMQWYEYVNHDIKEQELEEISKEYLEIFEKCSHKIKRKLGIEKTKSQEDASINPRIAQPHPPHQQQYVKKPSQPAINPNTSQPLQHQQQSRQTNEPHNNNHHHNVNIQKQFNSTNVKPGGGAPPSSSSLAAQQNGFNNTNSHFQQQQQRHPSQQAHHHQRSVSSAGPVHVSNYKQNNLTSSSSSSLLSNQSQSSVPSSNLNKSLNLPSKSSSNLQQPSSLQQQTSSSNPNKPNMSNGNGALYSSSQGVQNQPGVISSNKNLGNLTDVDNINKLNYNTNTNLIKRPIKTEPNTASNNLKLNNTNIKSSPTTLAQPTSSMKRANDETSNGAATMAPNNKIPKYVIDQKSAS